jgi:predicted metal-dependent hydrolase
MQHLDGHPPLHRVVHRHLDHTLAAFTEPGRLRNKATELSARIGVTPKTVLIREPKQRWGSCDANGALRLNWRIIQASPKLIDYVIAHELIHINHPNHSPTFWSNLGRVMPDYEQRREMLRKIGAGLVW